jgi:hypothetical protein
MKALNLIRGIAAAGLVVALTVAAATAVTTPTVSRPEADTSPPAVQAFTPKIGGSEAAGVFKES